MEPVLDLKKNEEKETRKIISIEEKTFDFPIFPFHLSLPTLKTNGSSFSDMVIEGQV